MSLRVPAIYRDQHWEKPKGKIDRIDLNVFRSEDMGPGRTGRCPPALSFAATCW